MHVWLPLVQTNTGSEIYTRQLAKLLRERGHEVTMDTVAHFFQFVPWLAPISPPRTADVVLANSWSATAFRRRGLPLVSVCHLVVHDPRLESLKTTAQKLFHRLFVMPMERSAVRLASINIAVSETVAKQMKSYLGADDVRVILNGVDTEFFCPAELDKLDREAERPYRLLFVGKPSRRKGFDIVAEIVERLGDAVEFTCVGPEPLPPLPRPPGSYTGPLDREGVRTAYRNADLLLLPSRMEGLPLVVLEAMACQVPVATFLGNSVAEFMPSGAGVICVPEDIDCLCSGIETLRRDREAQAKAAAVARKHILERATQNLWVDQTEAALLEAVERG